MTHTLESLKKILDDPSMMIVPIDQWNALNKELGELKAEVMAEEWYKLKAEGFPLKSALEEIKFGFDGPSVGSISHGQTLDPAAEYEMKAPIKNREIADKFTKTKTDDISRLVSKDFIDGFRTGVERWLDHQSDMRDKGIEHRAKNPMTEDECVSTPNWKAVVDSGKTIVDDEGNMVYWHQASPMGYGYWFGKPIGTHVSNRYNENWEAVSRIMQKTSGWRIKEDKPYTFLALPAAEIMVGIKSGQTWTNGYYTSSGCNEIGIYFDHKFGTTSVPWELVAGFIEENKIWEKK